MGAQCRQGVDLVRHSHGADLRRHGGTYATSDHQARHDGAEFAGHRQHDDIRDGALGVLLREAGIGLKRDHTA
ncbi:hypothetical protein AAJCM20276_24920 [Acetobacter aceti]|uniref:Uncharacterized protein n=1 Tax=Acetobacter aceti TaxID=435 RepID=A0A6S6PJ59_ACEAC|nr:hypothetical protein AAJCM20276_24920 [Acetobacter aceti]